MKRVAGLVTLLAGALAMLAFAADTDAFAAPDGCAPGVGATAPYAILETFYRRKSRRRVAAGSRHDDEVFNPSSSWLTALRSTERIERGHAACAGQASASLDPYHPCPNSLAMRFISSSC